MPQLRLSIPREGVIQSLRDLIATTTESNIAAFSRNLGISKTTLWELVQGYFPPSLPFLLQLCYQFRLSLFQFLVGGEHIVPGESLLSQEQTRKRDVHRPFDREKVQQALEDILADHEGMPLSMQEVAQRLGYPVRTIETHFPIPCREISRRYAEYRKQQGQLRKARLQYRINEAARIVLLQGENLTYQRVGSIIGKPGCFREYEARRALLDIRCRAHAQISLE
jgi:transcriptional regulator with XRE-family HTH domain